MNFQISDSKPVVVYNSLSKKAQISRTKLVSGAIALAVVGAVVLPATIYAWAPQPYCRNGQTVMVTYDEAGHHYRTQEGDVAGTCPSAAPSASPSAPASTAPCVATDLKGTLEHADNHETTNPAKGHLENVTEAVDCQNTVWVDIYGSKQKSHEGDSWLESQQFVSQQKFEVKKGEKKDISIEVPNQDFCWYQVDLVRNSDIKVPPRFNGNDMIDYSFVKDSDSCEASPAPSASSQGAVVINNTNNNTNNNTTNVTVLSPSSSPQVIAATVTSASELPKTGLPLAGLALGGLAPLGMKLKKFRGLTQDSSASFIWEQRQLSK